MTAASTPDPSQAWAGYRPQPQRNHDDAQQRHKSQWQWQRDYRNGGLDKIDWNGQKLTPVRKDFAYEHPTVAGRSYEECTALRLRWGIEVSCSREDRYIPKPVTTFEEAPFPDWVAKVLRKNRLWKEPTPIQVQAWTAALAGFDVVGIASTGSGKTMAYVLPMLVHVIAQDELKPGEGPIGLVLLPTRELCSQVRDEISAFTHEPQLRCESIFGGKDRQAQEATMLERVDIVTATLLRLITLLAERKTNLLRVTFVVIDEADDLLGGSFEEQTMEVLSQVRPDRQVVLFSATFQDNVKTFAERVCEEKGRYGAKGTIQIIVGGIKLSACKDINQQFWLQGKDIWPTTMAKKRALCIALDIMNKTEDAEGRSDTKTLVFVNKTENIDGVVAAIRDHGLHCEGFTGKLDTVARERVLQDFKDCQSDLRLLVCTSVLSRGHDFQNVRYVLNYDMPTHIVDYIHRIGRTGRRGEKGYSLTLLEDLDLRFARDIELCLHESGQHIPLEIEMAAKSHNIRKRWHDYRNLANGTAVADGDAQGGSLNWGGRGRGRRHLFLQELQGRGIARDVPLEVA